MEIVRGGMLIAPAVTMGLMTGVFGLYANAIMPGLRAADDRTFVGAFQSIDRRIINPLFLATFVGALVFSGGAAVLHTPGNERSVVPWSLAAFGLYLWVFVSTIVVNVPINDELKAAGDPDEIVDLGAIRARFDEARWARWNLARARLTTLTAPAASGSGTGAPS